MEVDDCGPGLTVKASVCQIAGTAGTGLTGLHGLRGAFKRRRISMEDLIEDLDKLRLFYSAEPSARDTENLCENLAKMRMAVDTPVSPRKDVSKAKSCTAIVPFLDVHRLLLPSSPPTTFRPEPLAQSRRRWRNIAARHKSSGQAGFPNSEESLAIVKYEPQAFSWQRRAQSIAVALPPQTPAAQTKEEEEVAEEILLDQIDDMDI